MLLGPRDATSVRTQKVADGGQKSTQSATRPEWTKQSQSSKVSEREQPTRLEVNECWCGNNSPKVCKTPLKLDLTENAPAKMSVGVEIPRVSAQSEIFSGFRLSPQKLNNLFRMHYIGGRLFFYTTVAVSLLCETGQVRIRAESPAQGGKSGHFCRDRRETDSGRVPVGGTFETSRKSGGPCRNWPEKCSSLEAKTRLKINKPR